MVIFKDRYVNAEMSQRSHGPMGSSMNPGLNDTFLANRAKFATTKGFNPSRIVMASQVHGANVEVVENIPADRRIENTDALITMKRQIPLAIFTADCIPVFIRWPKGIGLAHAGRVGLKSGVVFNTIEMIASLGAQRDEIRVWAGPAIQSCCYPTDLQAVLFWQLIDSDVVQHHIRISQKCTSCDPKERFFSFRHRRDQKEETKGYNMMAVLEML